MRIKGQGTIATLIIFGAVLMMALAIPFLTSAGQDNPVREQNVEASIDIESAAVQDQALFTYILHQKIGEITAGQVHDTSIFKTVTEPGLPLREGTICSHGCDDDDLEGIGEDLPREYQLYISARDLEEKVDSLHPYDPRRIQYNQFVNTSHPSYEPNIKYYGEHSDYHDSRKGGCNFDINEDDDYREYNHEDREVCTDFVVTQSREYNMTVYEAVQKYFSSNKFIVNGTQYDKNGVKRDLKNFLQEDYADAGNANLGHVIAEPGNEGELHITSESEEIIARSQNDIDVSKWKRYGRKIPTSNGTAEATLWVGRP